MHHLSWQPHQLFNSPYEAPFWIAHTMCHMVLVHEAQGMRLWWIKIESWLTDNKCLILDNAGTYLIFLHDCKNTKYETCTCTVNRQVTLNAWLSTDVRFFCSVFWVTCTCKTTQHYAVCLGKFGWSSAIRFNAHNCQSLVLVVTDWQGSVTDR